MADEKTVWSIEFYRDEQGHEPCREWMEGDLGDVQHDALVEAIRQVLARLGLDVCKTEWGKALGGGLYEFRVRHTAAEVRSMFGGAPPGAKEGERVMLRVFFHPYGSRIILLLGGYDKGRDPRDRRQDREIEAARKRLKAFKAREAAKRREARRGRR